MSSRKGAKAQRTFAFRDGLLTVLALLCAFAGNFLLRLSVNVIDDAGVIVSHEKRVLSETENVRRAAIYVCAVEEAGDEVFDCAAGGFHESYHSDNLVSDFASSNRAGRRGSIGQSGIV